MTTYISPTRVPPRLTIEVIARVRNPYACPPTIPSAGQLMRAPTHGSPAAGQMQVLRGFRQFPILKSASRGGAWQSLGENRKVTRAVYELRQRIRALRFQERRRTE